MTTQARKLEIIEQVLHLDSDEALALLEQALKTLAGSIPGEEDIPAMPPRGPEELAARLDQARADIKAGRTFSSEEMIARAQQWRAA